LFLPENTVRRPNGSDNDHDGNDRGAGLPRIEIDGHRPVHREQAGLVPAETDGDWRAALQEGHEGGLGISSNDELDGADGALEHRSASEARTDEDVPAGGRVQEDRCDQNGDSEARQDSPPLIKVYTWRGLGVQITAPCIVERLTSGSFLLVIRR
jgi:hypothetical protein